MENEIKLIIEIRGGNLVGTYSNKDMEIAVIDRDDLEEWNDTVVLSSPDRVEDDLAGLFVNEMTICNFLKEEGF